MNVREAQQLLNAHGFPCGAVDGIAGPTTRAAVERFQRACAMPGGPLAVDGILGPNTFAALSRLPHLSPHFVVAELRSKGDRTCYVRRELLVALEATRERIGRPIVLTSAYRDPQYNLEVGGAGQGQHPHGLAADVGEAGITVATAQGLGVWSGIGDLRGRVLHLDVRHVDPATNTTGSTPQRPARWAY
jgi:peptidoglycan hydrolase-like protein with peptidoglycan-binding domain